MLTTARRPAPDDVLWEFDSPKAVTAWVALDDATATNGCMHFIPGACPDARLRAAAATAAVTAATATTATSAATAATATTAAAVAPCATAAPSTRSESATINPAPLLATGSYKAVLNSPDPYNVWSDGASAISSDLGGIFEAYPQLADAGRPQPVPVKAGR